MVANPELASVDVMPTAEPIVLVAVPLGAWRTMTDLAQNPQGDQSHRHLRRALASTVQMDSVLHAVVMVNGDAVEISLHTHESAAEAALVVWLQEQPDLWPGVTLDDWHHLREAGLAPAGLAESTIMMLTVDTRRVRTDGGHR